MFLERAPGVVFTQNGRYRRGGPEEPWFDPGGQPALISGGTFPALAKGVDPLLETQKRFVTILDSVEVECLVGEIRGGPWRTAGRWPVPSSSRLMWDLPASRYLIDRLKAVAKNGLVACRGTRRPSGAGRSRNRSAREAGLDRHGQASVIPGGVEGDRQRGSPRDQTMAHQSCREPAPAVQRTGSGNGLIQGRKDLAEIHRRSCLDPQPLQPRTPSQPPSWPSGANS